MKPLKFGFLGAGQIAYSSAAAVNSHPNATVHAAQDLHAERLGKLCRTHNIPNGYATAQELFADPEVDVVYIAVPNRFHVPLAIEALEAGKHVMLEKPFAMNYTEASQAAETARRVGKVLTLGMNQRFGNAQQRMRSLVASGALGEVYHAKGSWFRRAGIPRLGTWFGSRELAGGGCLYDIGVHLLDLTLYVINDFKPVSVFGSTYTKFGQRGLGEGGWGHSDRAEIPFDVEDFASGQIRLASGTSVSLDVTWACHMDRPGKWDVELFGTEAGAHVLEDRLFRRDPKTGEFVTIESPCAPVEFPHGERFHNFINHLTADEPLCVTLEQALVVQRILDGIMESSQTGREVRLD